MNLKTILTASMLATTSLFAVGCASDGHERQVGQVFDDAGITTRVKSALIAEKNVKARHIKVETFEGVVQLSGFVNSKWEIARAGEVANGVEGVRSVRNDLIHKPSPK